MKKILFVSMVLILAMACTEEDDSRPPVAGGEGEGEGEGTGEGEGEGEGFGEGEGEGEDDGCLEATKYIHVIERDNNTIYRFVPTTQDFVEVGTLNCGNGSATPGSMGVARDGEAYVRYSDGGLYKIDLFDLSTCETTGYSDGATGFGAFGMGYAASATAGADDVLYIANFSTVATLDTENWTVTNIGSAPSQSELTGNSLGELWAFLPLESPPKAVSFDMTNNAAVVETYNLPGLPAIIDIDCFAFAYWGGNLYIFMSVYGMGSDGSDVYEVDENGTLTKIIEDIGFDVVGAGVSTCAPNTAPI